VTSLRELVESARATLPEAPFGRSATILFALSVLTLVISLAASEACLIAAALCYAVDRLRAARKEPGPGSRLAAMLRFPFPPVRLAVAGFCLLTIVSVLGAANSAAGWPAVRKLVLFLIMLLVVALPSTSRTPRLSLGVPELVEVNDSERSRTVAGAPALEELLYKGLFIASAVAGIVGVFQFGLEYRAVKAAHPDQFYRYMSESRIHGFMGHWMNFGGQQMLVFCVLLAYVFFSQSGKRIPSGSPEAASRPRGWGKIAWVLLGIIAVSIALNFTRGVWLGCFVAVVYLVARRKPRWLLVLPFLIALAILVSPSLLRERLETLLHPARDASIAIRLEMWQVALRMIRAHPGLGVGPNNIEREYTLYLPPGRAAVVGYHEHFHNNLFELAAERGLPCLAAWLWMMVSLLWGLIRLRHESRRSAGILPAEKKPPPSLRLRSPLDFRSGSLSLSKGGPVSGVEPWIVEGAIAAWLAFVAEGFFEFNFGTSPVLMVFLFVVSVPFARGRADPRVGPPAAGNQR
jgi:O-antigen ligase/polysaccharide polymerase Wzy-like membrane protein